MAEHTVRRAGLDDLAALVPLFDDYRRFYGQASDPERARGFLEARLQQGDSVLLLATDGTSAQAAAMGFIQLYPLFSSVHTSRLWLLNDLFVVPGARRQGVARELLEAAAAFARVDGAAGLMLETGRDNVAARALYAAAGWQAEQTQWYSLRF